MNTAVQTVTIDGKPYPLDSLSETARNQITNLRATEQEIARTQAMLSMLQTARQAYAQVLKEEMEKLEPTDTTTKH
ncbi:MAG: DUF6447 family protein [Betaproteobacteria bacterium]|nr:DUF6447 family protein [Betaproteobacteria bacterium]